MSGRELIDRIRVVFLEVFKWGAYKCEGARMMLYGYLANCVATTFRSIFLLSKYEACLPDERKDVLVPELPLK